MRKIIIILMFLPIVISCVNPKNGNTEKKKETKKKVEYKAFKYVDSFAKANQELLFKNSALREQFEKKCTQELKPLIINGIYNEIPLELTYSTLHNGKAYGNFIYRDKKYFVKVTCIIPKKILTELVTNEKYFIEFKTRKIEEGIYFKEKYSEIDLPVVQGYLKSIKKVE